jgi:5-methylcytosine-specific restriction endonuclease McrA
MGANSRETRSSTEPSVCRKTASQPGKGIRQYMNTKETDQPHFELRRLTYKLRPSRNVLLVPPDITWESIDRLIQESCWYWGGPLSLFVPCDGSTIAPIFWELVSLYDADYFYSPLPQDAFDAQLLDQLRMRVCPLEASKKTVGLSSYDSFRPHASMELPVLFSDIPAIDHPLVVWHIDDLPPYLQVFFHEHSGHLSRERLHQLRHPDDARWRLGAEQDLVEVPVEEKQLDADSAWSLIHSIWRGSDMTPKRVATWALAHIVYDTSGTPVIGGIPLDAPSAVIVGDTVNDYCLFHNLAVLRRQVHWLPKLPQDAESDEAFLLNAWLDVLADRLLYPHSARRPDRVLLFSTSRPDDALRATRDEIAGRLPERQVQAFRAKRDIEVQKPTSLDQEIRVDVASSCGQLLTHHVKYLEANNFRSNISQFYGGRAVAELNTPLPKNFDMLCFSHRYNWIAEVEIEGYRLPRRRDMVEGLLHGVSSPRVRLSQRGIAFCPMPRLILGGYDLPSQVVRPELTLLDAEDVCARLFAAAGLSMKVSNKGKYFRQALSKFGSLGELSQFLLQEQHQSVLARYSDWETRPGKGVTDQGIVLNQRRYLDLDAMIAALGIPSEDRQNEETYSLLSELLADWVGRGLVRRGLALKCQRCDNMDWYPIESVSEAFSCPRCGSTETWTVDHIHRLEGQPPEPSWYYQLDEALFQFVQANGFVTAATLAGLEGASSSGFMYLPEVEYWPESQKSTEHKPEIDFVAVADGKVLLGECKTVVDKIAKQARAQFVKHARLASQLLADGFVLGTVNPVSEKRLATISSLFE